MNAYLIVCGKKKFAVNADNMMEAEEKLAEELGDHDYGRCTFVQLDSMSRLDDDDEITFI